MSDLQNGIQAQYKIGQSDHKTNLDGDEVSQLCVLFPKIWLLRQRDMENVTIPPPPLYPLPWIPTNTAKGHNAHKLHQHGMLIKVGSRGPDIAAV